MENWYWVVAPANAVVGLIAAVVGLVTAVVTVPYIVAQRRKILLDIEAAREKARKEADYSLPPLDASAPTLTLAPPVPARRGRRVRWPLALVALSVPAVVAVVLWFSTRPIVPPPPPSPAPPPPVCEAAPPPRVVGAVLTAGSFTVTVPGVFVKSAPVPPAYPVEGRVEFPGWLVALSRKVEPDGSRSNVWYAQSVTEIDPGRGMTVRWPNWTSDVTAAEVCLLVVVGELPAGLRPSPVPNYGSISESDLAGLPADRAVRSAPFPVVVVAK